MFSSTSHVLLPNGLFTGSFMDTSVWVNAAAQNAFDTSAGTGQFVAYAAYMSREQSIVKYALGVPMGNNMVR